MLSNDRHEHPRRVLGRRAKGDDPRAKWYRKAADQGVADAHPWLSLGPFFCHI